MEMVIIETCNDVTANLWKRLCLAACALFLAVPAAAGASAVTGSRPGQLPIMDAETGQVLTSQELAARETDTDVLFMGEFHDNASIHETEAALLQDLYKQKQGKLALSLEMAERDTQPVLDSYLAGKIREDEYLAAGRPWPNYRDAYRPMVTFARTQKIPVIAANIPRKAAAVYAHTGSLREAEETWGSYMPQTVYPGSLAYERAFTGTMMRLRGQAMPISQDTIPRLFAAQCLKDNTMAESIDRYARAHGGHLVFHVTGAAHCEGWLGTVEQLHQRNPGLTIRVIMAVRYDPSRLSRSEAAALYRDKGDYLILVPEAMADTGSRG